MAGQVPYKIEVLADQKRTSSPLAWSGQEGLGGSVPVGHFSIVRYRYTTSREIFENFRSNPSLNFYINLITGRNTLKTICSVADPDPHQYDTDPLDRYCEIADNVMWTEKVYAERKSK